MVDGISIMAFLQEGMSLCFFIGFTAGVFLSAFPMIVRSITAIFKHIVHS